MPHPTVEELATVLCTDAGGQLTFRPTDLERLKTRALEENDRGLFVVVAELLDFAAYLEVCEKAPKAALLLLGLMVEPLAEALTARAKATGLHEDRADELAKRVKGEQKALVERHPLADGLAPRQAGAGGISLGSRPGRTGNTKKG